MTESGRLCEDCGQPGYSWEDGVIFCDDCALLRAKRWQMKREGQITTRVLIEPYSTEQLARVVTFFGDIHLARRFSLPEDVLDCIEWARAYLAKHFDGGEDSDA